MNHRFMRVVLLFLLIVLFVPYFLLPLHSLTSAVSYEETHPGSRLRRECGADQRHKLSILGLQRYCAPCRVYGAGQDRQRDADI